jgi:hypothetical protein
MPKELIGPALDALGVEWDRDPGEIITDVVLVAKYITADGEPYTLMGNSPGTDDAVRIGLVIQLYWATRAATLSYFGGEDR